MNNEVKVLFITGAGRGMGTDIAKAVAKALIHLIRQDEPPLRWAAGADAVATVEQKAHDLLAQADAYRDLSSSLSFDEGQQS